MTELIWDGKYKDGKKQGPVRIALPFQTIETVNESVQERQRSLEIFAAGLETEWRNRLIWGDKKYVLPSLLPEFAGKVNLIYIDPPFDTGADFSYTATIPEYDDGGEAEAATFTKEPSILEQKAYRDTWGRGLDSYLHWFFEVVVILRELLAQDGSIYVHMDARMAPYCRLVMDEVFGSDSFRNEIYWYYTNKIPDTRKRLFTKSTDTILFYARGDNYFNHVEEKREIPIKVSRMRKEAGKKIYVRGEDGKVEMIERSTRVVDNVWRLAMLHAQPEITGYGTQKPEALLERIIKASTRDIVSQSVSQ